MLKKIRTEDIIEGVYIEEFDLTNVSDFIYLEKMLVKNADISKTLKSWGIDDVFINTEKGLDIKDVSVEMKNRTKITTKIFELGSKKPARSEEIIEIQKELQTAYTINTEATSLIQKSMKDVVEGRSVNIERGYEIAEKMLRSIQRNRDALLLLNRIRQKDQYTLQHSISVCSFMLGLCNYYKLPKKKTLNLAIGALFHDIGKTLIPDAILNKPGSLTEEEFATMKKHALYSSNIVEKIIDLPNDVRDIAMHHHEKFDGSGYPKKLQGNDISFAVKLASVCDVFDAMTSSRCYKQALGTIAGLKEIYSLAGKSFDKKIAYDFIRFIGVYPLGSYVRLSNHMVGIVVSSTKELNKPIVKIIYDTDKDCTVDPFYMNLLEGKEEILHYENPDKFTRSPQQTLMEIMN